MLCSWNALAQDLKVTSELWPPHFTTPQSDGLYETIVRQAFPEYQIEFIYAPYYRSVQLVTQGKADLWLGSYLNENPEGIYPKHFFDVDEVSALHLQQTRFHLPKSLTQEPLGWIKGYEYQSYYPQIPRRNVYQLSSLEVGLRMLAGGRLKFILDDKSSLQAFLTRQPNSQQPLTITTFGLLPLYPGFTDNARGQRFAEQWDRRLSKMKASGALERLYQHYGERYLLDLCHSDPLPVLSCTLK